MQLVQEIIWFLEGNWDNIVITLLAVVALGEAVTKLTPTETDDGFVKRIGALIDKLLKIFPSKLKDKKDEEPPKAA